MCSNGSFTTWCLATREMDMYHTRLSHDGTCLVVPYAVGDSGVAYVVRYPHNMTDSERAEYQRLYRSAFCGDK